MTKIVLLSRGDGPNLDLFRIVRDRFKAAGHHIVEMFRLDEYRAYIEPGVFTALETRDAITAALAAGDVSYTAGVDIIWFFGNPRMNALLLNAIHVSADSDIIGVHSGGGHPPQGLGIVTQQKFLLPL